MARLRLGASPEELAQEEYEKQIALDKEIHERNLLKEKKLQELIKKQKKNRIIVITSLIVVIVSLLIFGTYNTFFKRGLSKENVHEIIREDVRQFPKVGLEGFIRNNFNTWFKEVSVVKDDKLGIERVSPILDTLRVDNIIEVSDKLVRTYFSMDIEVKNKDIENPDKTVTKGAVKRTRYRFYLPIERYSKKNGERVVALGYRPVSQLALFMNDIADTHEYGESPYLSFREVEKEEEAVLKEAKIKVDRILSDLYAKKDVSQELYSNLVFNGYGAKYVAITKFELYKGNNHLGYNTIVEYVIKTKEGFEYKMTNYLALRKNGDSWIIAGML